MPTVVVVRKVVVDDRVAEAASFLVVATTVSRTLVNFGSTAHALGQLHLLIQRLDIIASINTSPLEHRLRHDRKFFSGAPTVRGVGRQAQVQQCKNDAFAGLSFVSSTLPLVRCPP